MNVAVIKLLLFFVFIIWVNSLNANIGGATPKPGLIGDPIVWELTNISIQSEDLDLIFFEKEGTKYCSFSATYYLTSDTSEQTPVSAIFYGLKARNIEIFYNSVKLKPKIDSSEFYKIDSLIFSSSQRDNFGAGWYDWSELNKNGFEFVYNPKSENILKVTGDLELQPTKYAYGFLTPAIYGKHPFLNKESSLGNEYFKYLITPIETWKSVGEIRIKAEYPKDWSLSYEHQTESKIENSKTNTEYIILKDSLPSIFSISIHNKQRRLYIGGGNIGFSQINQDDFATRFGWEFGIYHGVFINTLIALEYDTDFGNYNQISLTAIPTTPWMTMIWPNIGLGIGVPVRFTGDEIYSGIKLRAEFSWSLFNISLNMDYLPKLQNSGFGRTYYGLTF